MAKQTMLQQAQKAYRKGKKVREKQKKKKVVTTERPKEKKVVSQPKPQPQKSTPKVSQRVSSYKSKATPKTPSVTRAQQQYKQFRTSPYKPTNFAEKNKAKKTTPRTTVSKITVGKGITTLSPEKRKYDYKKDLQQAYKKGSTKTYLGTDQKETTTKLVSKKDQKKQYTQQKTDFYKSNDWKGIKGDLKTKNQEGWRKALSDLGWTRKEIDDWMNSEEGWKKRKETYMASKAAAKKSINKEIAKGIKDSSTLKSVNALKKGEFNTMVTAQSLGKKQGNKFLKSSTKRFGTEDIREKIGSKTAKSAYDAPFMTGVLQGSGKGELFSSSVGKYNAGAKTAIEKTKQKKSYMAGYGVGLAADMGIGGVASRGASLASVARSGAAKLAGKGTYKAVTKEVAKEAAEEATKLSRKKLAGKFASNRAGELAAETPTNIMDAAKMSMDTDGNLDKKEFKKWLAINTAFTGGVGGAMEGIGAKLTSKQANKAVELIGKKKAGTITKEESEELAKLAKKLSKKSEATSISKDIADAGSAKINKVNAEMAKEVAEADAKNVPKGFQGGRKSRGQGKYTSMARQTAKQNESARRVAKRRKLMADEQARTPAKATTEAEIKAQREAAERYSSGIASTTEKSRVDEVHRLQDEVRGLRDNLADAENRAKTSGTMEGHARAVAEAEEIRKAIGVKEKQLKNARGQTLSGRLGKAQDAVKKENTLAGHEKAARNLESVEAEVKANAEAKAKKTKKLEQVAKKLDDKAKADPTPENIARAEIAKEAVEKSKADAKGTVEKELKDANISEVIQKKTPKEIDDRIKYLEENLPKARADRDVALKEHRAGFTEKNYRSDHHNTAKAYNMQKENVLEMEAELAELQRAKGIYEEAGVDFKALEEPKAETKREGGFATFDKEEGEAELAAVGLERKKPEPKIELEPKPGQSKHDAYREYNASEKQKAEHREELANKEKADKKKAEDEVKGLKSAWKKFYSMFVSELEPLERMAMSGATKEERKAGRVSINGMLTARSKAMTKIREEGMKIFESRGLHKNEKKAKDYDDYALFAHEMDRMKQKSILVNKDDERYLVDFGEGVIQKYNGKKENGEEIWKTVEKLPPDGTWRKYKKMSEEDIRADIEKFVKDRGYDWDQLVNDKSFTGLAEKDIKGMMSELGKQYGKDIKAYQKELVKYHKDLLKEDLRAGIISKERYFKLVSKYKNYIPTFRDYDAISQRSFNEDLRAANLYNAKGAENANDIIPQYTQMIAKTNSVMKRTAENEMLNVISRVNNIPVKDLPGGHTPDELFEVSSGVYTTKTGEHRIFFRQEGKGVSMEIGEEAYHAIRQWSGAERAAIMEFKLMNRKGVRAMAKGMTQASHAFKALITDYSLIFGCRNFVRDSATALVYSEHPAKWLHAFPKAVMAMKKGTKYHAALQQYIKDGGRYNALVTSTDLAKMPKIGQKEGIPGLRVIKEFNTAMETLPRMSEYISTVERLAKQNGITFEQALKNRKVVQEAMYNAKEVTLNFDRKGQYGAMLNRGLVPFFNPSVQGIDKLWRFLYKDNRSMSEFMAMGAKMAGMVAAPAVAWEALVNQGEMGEAYRKLSAYNKYAYFCIPMGKDDNGDWNFLKIPRAREMAAMQMPIDWFVQNVKWQNRDGTANLFESGKQLVKLGIEQIGPVNPLTDNYFSPIWNLAHNKNWMGGSIENFDDEDKRQLGRASDIYDTDTSSAAVAIMSLVNAKQNDTLKRLGVGADVTNWIKRHQVSPKQLDNVFDSYLGVIYDMGIRPFSQEGASLESVKKNPKEELEEWGKSTFGTAFVVNGTLSSNRKFGMYSKLDDLKDKTKEYPKGSKELADAKAELSRFQNNCVYDVQTFDTAINSIQRSKKYTGREKAAMVLELKRVQNEIIDDYNAGKNKVHDPIETLLNMKNSKGKRVFSDDYVFTKLTYTNDDGTNAIASGWNKMKSSDYYKKHPKQAVKDFKEVTLETRRIAGKCGDSKSFMSYQTMAVVCADKAKGGKDYTEIMDSYNVGKTERKMADTYINEFGGSIRTFTASHRHIVEGAARLGTYPGKLKDHDYAMILANARTKNGNKLKDRAYWIEDPNSWGTGSYAYQRMNYARCLSDEKYKDSNWSYRKVNKFAKKYGLSWNSSDEDIVNAINETYNNKTKEEKAALFGVIKPTDENPFGEVGDYSVDGDVGYENDGKGGRRRRGRRRRGHRGGGGGGGGTPFTPIINTAGDQKLNLKSSKWKVSDVTSKTKAPDSNLTDAYRKKLKKLRESTRK